MIKTTRSSIAILLVIVVVPSDFATAFNKLRSTARILQTYTQYSEYNQEMLDAVNAERAKVGLSPLCTNSKMAAAARRHSEDMAANDYMDHGGSDGSTMSQRITDAGFKWNSVAENVAAGQEDVASVMESWMNSEDHRDNILGADYTMFGTAYAYNADSKYKHYWTQDFGAGESEVCDNSDSTSSQATQQQIQDNVPDEALTLKKPSYATAPSSGITIFATAPSPAKIPIYFTPDVITSAPAANDSVNTKSSALIETPKTRSSVPPKSGCKPKTK
ncbi:hypothetical protein PsorP6_008853 [Peronosclerospora sorghi]|uniref:Uncharacterized protein n=1 Tax=Peronosclerospora sorghi TaxID=230839 RepID=A0ACC0W2P8_9STRA|nr:hypothetical protein PsorP6_008853 [Peronosclerospora sorghi]